MAAPVGVDLQKILDVAEDLLTEHGSVQGIALREVAERLGVRTQSLYAHLDGVAGLRRALALRGLDELAGELAMAAVGKAGGDAIGAIIRTYYAFATARPGLYDASLRPPGDDPELLEATARVTRPLSVVLATYGLRPAAVTHWYRIVFAGIHGFAALQQRGLLTLPGAPEQSLELMISAFVHEIERGLSPPASPAGRRSVRR